MSATYDQSPDEEALVGGKYRLKRLLGRGGMGAVYEAENTFLRAPVALKVVRPEVANRDEVLRRFIQEAQAAAQVRHANIVSVLDFGYDQERELLYIVQEFLEGTDLKRRIKEGGRMEPRAAIELLLPVMRALSHAHSKGVVHRDLKPDNIFLCDTPEGIVPKVIDFGIAKVLDVDGQSVQQTRSLMVMGTPLYMSPEQARGDRAVDHRTDIWQLGVVLYHMLSGRFPYEGTTSNLITAAIITSAPTRIETRAPGIPPDVAALVHGALAWHVEERFPSMDAFWQAARACSVMQPSSPSVTSSGVSALSQLPYVPPQLPQSAGTSAPHIIDAPRPATSRNRVILGVISALALFAVVSLVAVLSRKPTPAHQPSQPLAQTLAQPPAALTASAEALAPTAPQRDDRTHEAGVTVAPAPVPTVAQQLQSPPPAPPRRPRVTPRDGARAPADRRATVPSHDAPMLAY